MYAKVLTRDDQVRRFTITDAGDAGWEVREEEDDRLLRRALYDDWHRVERARMCFSIEALALREKGWIES